MYEAERTLARAARTAELTAAAVKDELDALRLLSQAFGSADPSLADDLGVEMLALVNKLQDRRTGARRMAGYLAELTALGQTKERTSPSGAKPQTRAWRSE